MPVVLCLAAQDPVFPSLCMTSLLQSAHKQKYTHYIPRKHAAASPRQCPDTPSSEMQRMGLLPANTQIKKIWEFSVFRWMSEEDIKSEKSRFKSGIQIRFIQLKNCSCFILSHSLPTYLYWKLRQRSFFEGCDVFSDRNLLSCVTSMNSQK